MYDEVPEMTGKNDGSYLGDEEVSRNDIKVELNDSIENTSPKRIPPTSTPNPTLRSRRLHVAPHAARAGGGLAGLGPRGLPAAAPHGPANGPGRPGPCQ